MKNLLLFALGCTLLFSSCKKEDDPFLNNQAPICPTGFTGPTCNVELEPKKITIQGVRVILFRSHDDNGWPWDFGSDADIYLTITGNGNFLLETSVKSNASSTANHHWSCSIPIYDPEEFMGFTLFDFDSGSNDDLIGSLFSKLYSEGQGFPSVLKFNNSSMRVELDVTYEF
ncbi:hypothetical protein [Aureispira sp. CCB-E]|uniref:hypothetical protein n=1 Tax=Aureispira sp. CCB-E TaxID=3051121 RepID=UPI002868E32E|nr:hypothetical protein [Aureispira sp. CCB-E]WMX17493.1 hypothetical protein QP953_14015 [Aureispira sp. CCB-E]